jgi:hypothetical protein
MRGDREQGIKKTAGAYVLENTPPPPLEGGISADVIWGKKRQREKEGKKGKETGRKKKENEKRESKRVK